MQPFNFTHLKELIEYRKTPSVSIYIPTNRSGMETKQAPIRLKNRIRKAQDELESRYPKAASDLTDSLDKALKLTKDTLYWQNQNLGFALFVGPDFFRHFRLSLTVPETSSVGGCFHIKPLLPLFAARQRYYLLAVALQEVRFYEVNHVHITEHCLPQVPRSIQSLRQYDDPEKQIQVHTAPQGKSPGRAAVFHGQGSATDEKEQKKRIAEFIKLVVRKLEQALDADNTPVILLTDPYIRHLIVESKPRFHLMKEYLPMNPHHLTDAQLLEKTQDLVQNKLHGGIQDTLERYTALADTNRVISKSDQILPLASEGRVGTLFVDIQEPVWGYWDQKGGLIQVHNWRKETDEDLSDLAVLQTLLHNGQVLSIPKGTMKSGNPMVAILRY